MRIPGPEQTQHRCVCPRGCRHEVKGQESYALADISTETLVVIVTPNISYFNYDFLETREEFALFEEQVGLSVYTCQRRGHPQRYCSIGLFVMSAFAAKKIEFQTERCHGL